MSTDRIEHGEAEHVQAEKVEKELNTLIERRALAARKGSEQERIDALWAESVRKVSFKERRKNRAAWYDFHERMRDLHTHLSEEHRAKAESLLEEGV